MPGSPIPYDALGVLIALTAAGPAGMALLPESLRPQVSGCVVRAFMGAFLLDALLALAGTLYLLWASHPARNWCDAALLLLILVCTLFLLLPYIWFGVFYIREPTPGVLTESVDRYGRIWKRWIVQ